MSSASTASAPAAGSATIAASAAPALYAERSGRGPPLVLLHGWAMNLRVFDPLRAQLAAHHEVTAIDLPGHGRSPWPDDWSVARQLALLGALVPPGATLVGWSLGAQLALQLAAERGPAVRALVLLAGTPRFVQGPDWATGLAPATLERFALQLERDVAGTVADFLALQVRGSRQAAETVAALRAALIAHGMAQPAALRAGLALLRDQDLRSLARGLEQPALVIAGQYDRVTPPAAGRALAALLPRGRYAELARAGHAPFLSHAEAIGAAIVQQAHSRVA